MGRPVRASKWRARDPWRPSSRSSRRRRNPPVPRVRRTWRHWWRARAPSGPGPGPHARRSRRTDRDSGPARCCRPADPRRPELPPPCRRDPPRRPAAGRAPCPRVIKRSASTSLAASMSVAPRRVLEAMACTIANRFFMRWLSSLLSRSRCSSARLRASMSETAATAPVTAPSSPCTGTATTSIQTSLPSARR